MENAVSPFGKEYFFFQEEELYLYKKQKQLILGIPDETEKDEKRICLTPESVQLLVEMGHKVLFQRGAGKGAQYTDIQYCEAGAEIVETPEEVYTADIILKVTTVSPQDTHLMKPRQIILSSLKLFDLKKEAITGMMQKKVTAIGFDLLKDSDGYYPVERLMSEITGNTAVMIAAEYLSNTSGGKGIVLGGVCGITPTEIVILGAGTQGEFAARTAMGLGATVKIFDYSLNRLRALKEKLGQSLYTSVLHTPVLEKALKTADVVIGALRYFEVENNFILKQEQVDLMKQGAVLIDLSADQGGCIETVRSTTHENPTYLYQGIIHYCVPNILSRVPRTASIAYSNVLLPILKQVGECGGFSNAFKTDLGLRNGIYIYNGILTKQVIADKFHLISRDTDLLLAAL